MNRPQCVHCKANIDLDTGLCLNGFCCEHWAKCDFQNCKSFTCIMCGITVDVSAWRAKNFQKYLQAYILKI